MNYAELWEQIRSIGCRLQEASIGSAETVAVLMQQGVMQVLAVSGVLNHCICFPLQPKTTAIEVQALLARSAASAVIVSADFDAESEAAIAMGLKVLIARNETSPRDWQIRCPARPPHLPAANSEAILLMTTAATTGNSKLAPLTATNLNAGVAPRRELLHLRATDRLLQMTSMSHSMGIENTLAQFLAGGTVIATAGFDPAAFPGWLCDLRPTWYDCSPTVHKAVLAQLKRKPLGFPLSLRFVSSAGAPLLEEIKTELTETLGVPVWNDYGATEAGCIASDAFLPGGPVQGSTGRTCGLEIRIVGSQGEAVEVGGKGEIAVRGPAVFPGYLDDPEATRAAFHGDWFRTGDVGWLDEDGNLFVTGRLKEMINRGGEKIAPGEVDAAMASHPAVVQAAAFPIPHPTLGEAVACAVVLDRTAEPPPQISELRRFAANKLARFKVPSRIYLVDDIPRGELGKPQRFMLAERLAGRNSTLPSAAEMTERASDVAFYRAYEICSRILDRDDLGFDENFFDAGGDSLGAITMLAEVDQRFGSQASSLAASFLDEPTLARLVELVGEAPLPRPSYDESSDIRVFPVRDEGSPQRLFCVPADGDEGLYFRRLATHLNGQIDLFAIRPANTWFSQSLFTFEQAGAATARLIRQSQPDGPYLVGGYCSGGVVAIEAVRQLVREGADVRLVLFDAYMPGHPSQLRGWRTWIASARAQRQERGQASKTNFALDAGYILKRLSWSVVTSMRPLLAPVERVAAVNSFLRRVQVGSLPYYKAGPVQAPILHFLCADEPNLIDRESRFGWRDVAPKGITEEFLAFDHVNLFHESNLPRMVATLLEWSKSQRGARMPDSVAPARFEVSA